MSTISPFVRRFPRRAAVLFGLALATVFVAFILSRPVESAPPALTMAERATYLQAVEEVFWRHRIWPAENRGTRPALSNVVPGEVFAARAEESLRLSNAIETLWGEPITGEMLQAELNRMAAETRQPEVLRELFAALGNDPALAAEILARPALTERLAHDWYDGDERFAADELPFQAWWEASRQDYGPELAAFDFAYTLPAIGEAATLEGPLATDDTWVDTPSIPDSGGAAAVWSGSEMIFWGGVRAASGGKSQEGWSYNPATNTWKTISAINAPLERYGNTAVWTGSEMIVWGGCGPFDYSFCATSTGGIYNPVTDSWRPTSNVGAPSGNVGHSAVWTGSKMIVWGGCTNAEHCYDTNTGGIYDYASNSWTATSLSGAPSARTDHTAVWTGSKMVVWGGWDGIAVVAAGGRFDPASNTWQPVNAANQPAARVYHKATWATGDGLPGEMVVWGGCDYAACLYGNGNLYGNGARYNPATDTWTAMSATGAPSARISHSSIWTGNQLIIWGGQAGNNNIFRSGGRYNRATNSWTPVITLNTSARASHQAVWTGSLMLVWGGTSRTGERYNPANNSWTRMNSSNPDSWRSDHKAIWTGAEMIAWGGSDTPMGTFYGSGVIYTPATASWRDTSLTNAPGGRYFHTLVWTGTEMLAWGGQDGSTPYNTGGRFKPATNTWQPITTQGAPAARGMHTAVWTGSEMVVWGGSGNTYYMNTGGRYNPARNTWQPVTTSGAPAGRYIHTAVWTGQDMIVWGGYGASGELNSGGRYKLKTGTWTALSTTNAPAPRYYATGVWTGQEMIVWGGRDGDYSNHVAFNTGGRYNPITNSWQPTAMVSAPQARSEHTAIWTGVEMIVWGGNINDYFSDGAYTGGRYNPSTNLWRPTAVNGSPFGRTLHTAVWTGNDMIVWGGITEAHNSTGGHYQVSYAPDNTPPVIGGATATDLQYNSARIVWTTNEGASSQVEYGLTPAYGSWSANDPSLVLDHSVTLTGLTPSTTYFFRIHTKDWAGNEAVSGEMSFATPRIPDVVQITAADYFLFQQRLDVSATSSDATATLTVYLALDGSYIGTLTNLGNGNFSGSFFWPQNPSTIRVSSNYGGEHTRYVVVHYQ